MPTFSFAVTAFNEMTEGREFGQRLLAALSAPQAHRAIDEIVVVDDCSDDFRELEELLEDAAKVRLCQNKANRGVFGNKLEAIAQCVGEWVITCDSDNQMTEDFIDRIVETANDPIVWHCPSFARPNFDYRELIGLWGLADVADLVDRRNFGSCFNTGNQTVHREAFLEIFGEYRDKRFDLMMPNYLDLAEDERRAPRTRLIWDACDSFVYNMEWLLAGGMVWIQPMLEYLHHFSTGPDSNYSRAPREKERLAAILAEKLRVHSIEAKTDRGQVQ